MHKRKEINPLILIFAVFLSSVTAFLLLSSLILYLSGNPVKYIDIAAAFCLYTGVFISSFVYRRKGGNIKGFLIFIISLFVILSALSFTENEKGQLILSSITVPCGFCGYYITKLFKPKRKKRRRI